jgi:hypothetical protein
MLVVRDRHAARLSCRIVRVCKWAGRSSGREVRWEGAFRPEPSGRPGTWRFARYALRRPASLCDCSRILLHVPQEASNASARRSVLSRTMVSSLSAKNGSPIQGFAHIPYGRHFGRLSPLFQMLVILLAARIRAPLRRATRTPRSAALCCCPSSWRSAMITPRHWCRVMAR